MSLEFSKKHKGLCEREMRGSKKQKSKRLLEASLGSLGPVLKTVREVA